jgi:DNA-binding NarL/FixJ family response regulator
MSIRVSIVEDAEEIRESLAVLLRSSEGFSLQGTYGSAEAALEKVPLSRPDVLLMDINLPGMSGIDCVRKLKLENPDLQVIMLTVYEDPAAIFDSLSAGASGYLLKRTTPDKILEAIRDVSRGGAPMSSQIARKVVQSFSTPSAEPSQGLTTREHEIVGLLARGYRYKEIGEALHISVETVRSHLHKVYEKLHVRSRTEAVRKYFQR